MKKTGLLLLISLFWFSCELSDSGRMAVIDFNFTQPDILKSEETQSVPDRIIPLESKTVVVVMYPSYSDGVIEDDFWSIAEGQMGPILDKADTRVLYMNFGTGFSGGSLENIEPGKWSFAVFTFNTVVSNTEDILANVPGAMTWRIKKNVDIVPGMNLVDLPLKLNYDIYTDASTTLDVSTTGSVSTGGINSDETVYLSAQGFQPGSCRITYNPLSITPDNFTIILYTEEGYLIDMTPTTVSSTEAYLTFSPTSATYKVIISAGNSDLSGVPIGMYFADSDYSAISTQNLTINVHANT